MIDSGLYSVASAMGASVFAIARRWFQILDHLVSHETLMMGYYIPHHGVYRARSTLCRQPKFYPLPDDAEEAQT